ncbi:MAG: Uma2 family endonuclease, partial [Chloroflexota bacterium]
DDTEEDLVGANWHQEAIGGIVDALRDHAEVTGLPWHVGNQLPLVAWKPDGTAWQPSPDVMVHPAGGPEWREEMSVHTDGLPTLVIEVVSRSTWRYDQDTGHGKAWGYLALGIPEVLLFDPSGEFLDPPGRGLRTEEGAPVTWQPDHLGRYHSALGVIFQVEGPRLRVLDRQFQPIPFRQEKTALVARGRRELERSRRAMAERDARIARLEAELAALRGNDEP